jgi:hypothetical protein
VESEKKAEAASASKKVKELNKAVEKSTLGDLSALSDLKRRWTTHLQHQLRKKKQRLLKRKLRRPVLSTCYRRKSS